MTAAAAAVAARLRARSGAAVSEHRLAVAVLGPLVVLLAAFTWGTWGDVGGDTGYDLVAGARVAQGDIPYVDFVYFYGPLAPVLLGIAGALGGAGVAPAAAVGLILAASIVALTYVLGRQLVSPVGAVLAAAIVAPVALGPGAFGYVLPHTYSASAGLLALLLSLYAMGRFAASGDRRVLVLAGAGAGLVALTRPEYELAILAAAALWLVLRARSGARFRSEAGLFAAPALGIPALVYGAFAAAVGPRELVYENLYPVDTLASAGNSLLRLHAPFTLSSFAEIGGRVGLYAAGAAVLTVAATYAARRAGLQRPALIVGAAATAAAVAAALARSETLRYGLEFVYGWIPAGAVAATVLLVWRFRKRDSGFGASEQVAVAGAAALAVLSVKTYNAFFLHAPVPQIAAYAAPFAALFLVRLHLTELARNRGAAIAGAAWLALLAAAGVGLTLKDARADSATISGPGGALKTTPTDAAAYTKALEWIAAGSEPGGPILLAPQLTTLYVLSGREDPLPQLSLLPGALPSPADERAAIARLEDANVRLVVVDMRPFLEYGHGSFGTTFDQSIRTWLNERFVRAARLPRGVPSAAPLEVWVRRGS